MKKTILVVEDEFPLLDAITEMLEKKGYAVASARSAKEVFELLEDLPGLAAVWLDHYILGRENGLDIVARMKQEPSWKNIPIFVVSNTATDDKVTSYIQLGVEKFYVKSEAKIHDIIEEIHTVINSA
ncbi:MAG: response regulator [Patescibacteria group bacterium UBA2103]